MTNKKVCVVCGAAGGDNVSYHCFPKDEQIKKVWIFRIPLRTWKRKKDDRLCSRHFLPTDFKSEKSDSNPRRKSESTQLKKRILKEDAIPSIWPKSTGEPIELPEPSVHRESKRALPSVRMEISDQELMEKDLVKDITCLKEKEFQLPPGVAKVCEESSVTFVKVNTLGASAPVIQYALKVSESLEYEVFWLSRKISPEELIGKSLHVSYISYCKLLLLSSLTGKRTHLHWNKRSTK